MTALCLTRNRREWLRRAVACFRRQKYRRRELVIVADGSDVSDVAEGDARVRYFHISEGCTVGEKRNFGSEKARGEVVVSFDDDDWSAPDRIGDQVGRLKATGAFVTGYTSMLFTDGRRWWRFRGHKTSNLGSSLCYRRKWWEQHPFPAKQIGEDATFIEEAAKAGAFVGVDARALMVASIHEGNTSPRMLSGDSWQLLEEPPEVPGYE